MAERLTDKTPFTSKPDALDVLHMVDISDTTSNPAGTSFKLPVEQLMKFAGFMLINGARVLKSTGNESLINIQAGDFGIYVSPGIDRLVIFTAKVNNIVIPTDLDDSGKVAKWVDETPKL